MRWRDKHDLRAKSGHQPKLAGVREGVALVQVWLSRSDRRMQVERYIISCC